MKPILSASEFTDFPNQLFNKSAYVDFLHLLFCSKLGIRTRIANPIELDRFKNWSERCHIYYQIDEFGYLAASFNEHLPPLILEVDAREEPHEFELGNLLGYPTCCTNAIAQIGEMNIDSYETFVDQLDFQGRFNHINPKDYSEGKSLICHLPCSPTCVQSLEIAEDALRVIAKYQAYPAFRRWKGWLKTC